MHRHLIRFGPALLVVLGLILGGLGVGLDREWLVGLALVPLFLGILLPRLTGSIEVGPSGVKGQLISPDEVRALVRVEAEAAGLPEDEIERVVEKVDEVVPQAVELRLSPARARANASLDLRVIGRSLGGTIADGIVSDYGRDARLDEGKRWLEQTDPLRVPCIGCGRPVRRSSPSDPCPLCGAVDPNLASGRHDYD